MLFRSGFAVVASEIKQLADQSSQGADSIKNIADNILEKSNRSVILTGRMKELAEQEQTDIGNAKESFDILNRIIEENAAIAQTVMDKTKNLEALKLDIINSVSELSAISEENAASNEEVTARVTEIAESVNRVILIRHSSMQIRLEKMLPHWRSLFMIKRKLRN